MLVALRQQKISSEGPYRIIELSAGLPSLVFAEPGGNARIGGFAWLLGVMIPPTGLRELFSELNASLLQASPVRHSAANEKPRQLPAGVLLVS